MRIHCKSPVSEVFQKVVRTGLQAVNVASVNEDLKEKGRTEEDIKIALDLMACIVVLNEGFFSGVATILNFAPSKDKFDLLASYDPPESDQEDERYTVHAEDISKRITEPHKLLLVNPDGGLIEYKQAPQASYQEHLIGIAAHEVRHRLQHHNRVRIFTLEYARDCPDKVLKTLIEFRDVVMKEEERMYREEGRPEEFINSRKGAVELDARVIEELVMAEIHRGADFSAIYKAMAIQA